MESEGNLSMQAKNKLLQVLPPNPPVVADARASYNNGNPFTGSSPLIELVGLEDEMGNGGLGGSS